MWFGGTMCYHNIYPFLITHTHTHTVAQIWILPLELMMTLQWMNERTIQIKRKKWLREGMRELGSSNDRSYVSINQNWIFHKTLVHICDCHNSNRMHYNMHFPAICGYATVNFRNILKMLISTTIEEKCSYHIVENVIHLLKYWKNAEKFTISNCEMVMHQWYSGISC